VTAAKESWKPALKRLSGVTTSMKSAANATLRIANAGRSAMIAMCNPDMDRMWKVPASR
jgi:hypothetical protein